MKKTADGKGPRKLAMVGTCNLAQGLLDKERTQSPGKPATGEGRTEGRTDQLPDMKH